MRALLFCDEVRLTDSVAGTSSFAATFAKRGPFDKSGRSLREFDLTTRLFRYPCSFLIYSDVYQSLPQGVATRVRQMLKDVLSGEDDSEDFEHLTKTDREAIAGILKETLPKALE